MAPQAQVDGRDSQESSPRTGFGASFRVADDWTAKKWFESWDASGRIRINTSLVLLRTMVELLLLDQNQDGYTPVQPQGVLLRRLRIGCSSREDPQRGLAHQAAAAAAQSAPRGGSPKTRAHAAAGRAVPLRRFGRRQVPGLVPTRPGHPDRDRQHPADGQTGGGARDGRPDGPPREPPFLAGYALSLAAMASGRHPSERSP